MAYDQDTGINARLRYSIILGNEGGFFEMNAQTGELFLIREIDLEKLNNPTLSLQIQASQVDNPFRQALARVDISVQDINDNSPEVSIIIVLILITQLKNTTREIIILRPRNVSLALNCDLNENLVSLVIN